jgi:cytochrome b561
MNPEEQRAPIAQIVHPTEDIHGYLAYTLFALVGLHLLAALWHSGCGRPNAERSRPQAKFRPNARKLL